MNWFASLGREVCAEQAGTANASSTVTGKNSFNLHALVPDISTLFRMQKAAASCILLGAAAWSEVCLKKVRGRLTPPSRRPLRKRQSHWLFFTPRPRLEPLFPWFSVLSCRDISVPVDA